MIFSRWLCLSAFLLAAACSSPGGSPGTPDAGDTGTHDVCHPAPGAPGNEKGVGSYCSPGGGECDQNGPSGANACAIDLDPEGSNFCILLFCKSNEQCGADACCTGRGNTGPRACVPRTCVVDHAEDPCPPWPLPADGGTDVPDAGESPDAGQ